MYEVPDVDQRPGCRDTIALTRATFAVIIPALLAMLAVLGAIVISIVLFAIHPALALIPFAVIVAGVALYARWERSHLRPPDL